MKPVFICHAKCTTCQKARKRLNENRIDYDERRGARLQDGYVGEGVRNLAIGSRR